MGRLRALTLRMGLAAGAWAATSCAPSGFENQTQIDSVRILASSADTPYAAPGATVNLSVLAVDGRQDQPEPMQVYWIPLVCKDPPNDAYYGCFAQLEGRGGGGADAGAGAGAGAIAKIGPGVDLTPFLEAAHAVGPTFRFTMPADAVTAHEQVPGTDAYGIAILFNIACAGHLELLPIDPSNINPQTVPLGCFDKSENRLGPRDFVFGFTRVYSYPPDSGITNANPVIGGIDVDGQSLDILPGPAGPGVVTRLLTHAACTAGGSCPKVHLGPVVPASSQEAYTLDGAPRKEEIWADFFASIGTLTDGARLLYDATSGSIGGPDATDDQWQPPDTPGEGTIWIVVHDNRGGATWATIHVLVQ